MKRTFTIIGFLYVTYAILTAYAALDRLQANPPEDPALWHDAREVQPTPRDWQPMDFVDTPTYANVKEEYRIEAWTIPGCHWCDKWKRKELPKLKKAGVIVKIRDATKEKKPKDVRSFPTFKVYRRTKCIKTYVGYTKSENLQEQVKVRVVLLR